MNLIRYSALLGTLVVIILFSSGCAKSSLKSLFRFDSEEAAESFTADYDHVEWHESIVLAMRESAQTGKPILADFTGSDWCHWCKKLDQDVFETKTFKKWSRQNVVLLELDYPQNDSQRSDIKLQNEELAKRYNVEAYPTVLLLNSNGEVLGRLGYQADPDAWIASAESFLQPN